MYLARLDFPKVPAAAVDDELWRLLIPWRDRGRVFGERKIVAAGDVVSAFVSIPEADALNFERLDEESLQALKEWEERGLSRPVVQVLGPELEAPTACACARPSAYLLLASLLSDAPPIRCLDCLGVVPFYRIKGWTRDDANAVGHWHSSFRACDRLYMDTGAGEQFGGNQIRRYNSVLSIQGREVAARLQSLLGAPMFYHLVDFRQRSAEARRKWKCPSCGGDWLLAKPLHFFKFKCRKCRLLSTSG